MLYLTLVDKEETINVNNILNRHYQNQIHATSGTGANINIKDIQGNTITTGTTEEIITFKARTEQEKIIREINKELYDTYKNTITILPGLTQKTIGLIGQYTTRINNVIALTNITWQKMPTEQTIIQGNDITEIYQELQQDTESVRAILELEGYKNDTIKFENIGVGTTEKTANQIEEPNNYNINISGKAINGPATQRITNRNQAITLENAGGEKFNLDLDINGEFNGNINVTDTTELIKIYTNSTTLPEYSKTFSIVKHNEEYPINRGLGNDYSTCDWVNPADTTVNIQANLLNDDNLRISIVEKELAESENIHFAMKNGSAKYEPTEPLEYYTYTKDIGTGQPITTEQQQMYEEQMTKAIAYANLPETGAQIPTTQTTSDELPSTVYAKTTIWQWNGQGNWNGISQGSEIGYIIGSDAQTDAVTTTQSTLNEIMSRYFSPGAGGIEEYYCFTWNNDSTEITGTTDEGKLQINMSENWEPLSGKTTVTAFNVLTKEALDNKDYLTAQIAESIHLHSSRRGL